MQGLQLIGSPNRVAMNKNIWKSGVLCQTRQKSLELDSII